MTPAARVQASIEVLDAVFSEGRPADAVVGAYFRNRRYIGSKDRTEIASRVYGALRAHARLGWWIARGGLPEGARSRVIAHLAMAEGRKPETLPPLFDGSPHGPRRLDKGEQSFVNAVGGRALTAKDMPDDIASECPDWALPGLKRAFGDRFAEQLLALLDEAPMDLRVNEFKDTRDAAVVALRATGLDAEPTALSPIGIRVRSRSALGGNPLFRAGVVEVQDEGSQIVALLADARPGQQVVDFCAGAGGKALVLAARMHGKGRVVACDVSEGRLTRAKERIRRAGVDNIEARLLSSERDKWVKRHKGKFDRVLVDAPCSGVGAWRRNPDARWRGTDLAELTRLQSSILESASRLTKPGGRILYATCSLLPEENEDRIEAFLASHSDFRIVPVAEVWTTAIGSPCPTPAPMLRLTPREHATDGFFVAIMERAGDISPSH